MGLDQVLAQLDLYIYSDALKLVGQIAILGSEHHDSW